MDLNVIKLITDVGSFGLVVFMFLKLPSELRELRLSYERALKEQREFYEKMITIITDKFSANMDRLGGTIDRQSMLILHLISKNSTPQEYATAVMSVTTTEDAHK